MATETDYSRANFNGDGAGFFGSFGDLALVDDAGHKAIWLIDNVAINGALGERVGTGSNLPNTGNFDIVAEANFNTGFAQMLSGGNNPAGASDLLFQNPAGVIALWQSTGSNVNPFPAGGFQFRNLNPGSPDWDVVSANDFNNDG